MGAGLLAIAAASALAWLALIFGRHGFWRADQRLGNPGEPAIWPDVVCIIPARNEAATIARTVESVLAQDYPGRLHLIVVDDASADGTADIARAAAPKAGGAERFDLVSAPPLAAGWSGKLWALQAGVERAKAQAQAPEFYWFTDADIVHGPHVLRRLVVKAELDGRDLVSLMVRLNCTRFWERLLVPAFVFFFQMLYPFPAVNDPASKVAGAAGGCVLLRRRIFESAGGFAAMRDALIDDCTLAARVQAAAGRLWLGLADDSRSLRAAEGLASLWHMVKRTAFVQLDYSAWRLLGTVLGLGVTFLAPPVVAALAIVSTHWPAAALAAMTWIAMAMSYRPSLAEYDRPALEGLLLPAVALLYSAMTIHAAIDHWRGRGSGWKGRAYAEDMREGQGET